jgi:predicted DNA-binding protein
MVANSKFISIRMDVASKARVKAFSSRLDRKTAHVTREAIEVGIGIMEMPEYFTARLAGQSIAKIQAACRIAIKELIHAKVD